MKLERGASASGAGPGRARGLGGVELALTGRLASMTRAEAQRRIEAAGGRLVASPGPATALLVVGSGGPPLGDDGRLTQSLREARALQELGCGLRIAPEEELLELLGLSERDGLGRLYTTEQLARVLGVPARSIRAWVRHGLIEPAQVVRRLAFFEFRQVATARALSRLAAAGVRPAAIRDSLERLGAWLGQGEEALAQLETLEQSRLLVVRTEDGLVEPDGQLRLDFEARGERAGEPPAPHARGVTAVIGDVAAGGSAPCLAPDWFELGALAEEEGRLEDAAQTYARAAEQDPARAEVHFNLGNVLYALERKADAVQALLRAVEQDPEYVEAWNNLGNIMADVGEIERAETCFAHALELEPDYTDARYNLAEVLANEGDYERAREHWRAYLASDPFGATAELVRERLQRTQP